LNHLKPTAAAQASEFFSSELEEALRRNRVSTRKDCFRYLVDLLVRHISSKEFFATGQDGELKAHCLADLYAHYLRANSDGKRSALRKLGDVCLMVSGFFADSIGRKIVDIEYYFGMGGTAYHTLSQMQLNKSSRHLFGELAVKFQPFSNVLHELSENAGIQSNSDLLRLYERWLVTGSDRLREKLSEHGISSPSKTDIKTSH
jgi:hypothetical protein